MRTFPVMLALEGRTAVVVGAGAVGLRKARSLQDAGATVRLVTGDAKSCKAANSLEEVHCEAYRPAHLCGAVLVFACTDDAALNQRIAADARREGILANAVDQPDDCDFFSPAVWRDGQVVLAASTGGASPALAGWLRDRLAEAWPERIGEFAQLLGELRDELRRREPSLPHRTQFMKSFVNEETYRAFLVDGAQGVHRRFQIRLNGGV